MRVHISYVYNLDYNIHYADLVQDADCISEDFIIQFKKERAIHHAISDGLIVILSITELKCNSTEEHA